MPLSNLRFEVRNKADLKIFLGFFKDSFPSLIKR